MPTLEQVWSQIHALPHRYIFYTKKEIRYLPKILSEDERILAVTSGLMEARTWLAVCTDRRILFLDRGMFFGLRQVQINLDRLQTIESDSGLLFGSIRVVDSGSSMMIRMVLKQSIAPFVRVVQDAMDAYKRTMVYDLARAGTNALSGSTPGAPKAAFVTELESLARLRAEGHLTDDEYAAAKTKLLQH